MRHSSSSSTIAFVLLALTTSVGSFQIPPQSFTSTKISRPTMKNNNNDDPFRTVFQRTSIISASRCSSGTRRSSTTTALALSIGSMSMPAVGSIFGTSADLGALAASVFADTGTVPLVQAFGINAILFSLLASKLATMLTPAGFAHSFALGTMLWATLGWKGWLYCVSYLFLGQLVTKVRFAEKEKAGIAEKRGGRRGPENVWGSAATALICAACSVQGSTFLGIGTDVFVLGYVASLATKLADTFASEIGKAYGKTTFLITTFERVQPGTEGAVSLEGTVAAAFGGLALSLVGYALGFVHTIPAVLVSTFAAFVACNVESLLGATIQEKKGFEWITNEVINFINTVIGAGIAISMGKFLLGML